MITRKHRQLEINLKDCKKLWMRALVKWLNFSRCDFQLLFQSSCYSDFTPAAQLYRLNSNLPSLQQCLQSWEIIALEATGITPSPCHVKTLSQGQTSPVWDQKRTAPSARSLFLPAGSEGHRSPANTVLASPPLNSTAALRREVYESVPQQPGAPTGLNCTA